MHCNALSLVPFVSFLQIQEGHIQHHRSPVADASDVALDCVAE